VTHRCFSRYWNLFSSDPPVTLTGSNVLRYILIVFSHPSLGFWSGVFSSGLLTKKFCMWAVKVDLFKTRTVSTTLRATLFHLNLQAGKRYIVNTATYRTGSFCFSFKCIWTLSIIFEHRMKAAKSALNRRFCYHGMASSGCGWRSTPDTDGRCEYTE
jgi:hypothetical protein